MQSQHRRQPMRLNSCASRQVFIRVSQRNVRLELNGKERKVRQELEQMVTEQLPVGSRSFEFKLDYAPIRGWEPLMREIPALILRRHCLDVLLGLPLGV
jgi:hypothetical protein